MDNLRALQLTELDILKEVLSLFEKNHITYYALGGTMLGAVRHKGFIPWDDDIDIGVPREDYERLKSVCEQLPSHLRFLSFQEDPSYPYFFSRVVDDRVTVKSNRAEAIEVTPAWIDIFPLDGMPDNTLLRFIHSLRILYARMLFNLSRFSDLVNIKRKNRPIYEKAIIQLALRTRFYRWIDRKRAFERLDRILRKSPYAGSSYNINAMGAYKLKEMFHKKVFGSGKLYRFEDILIHGPRYYNSYLTQLYGNWKVPADLTHHSIVSVTQNSPDA